SFSFVRLTLKVKDFTYTYDVKYYINNRKYWCKGYYRNYCTIIASTTTETKNIKVDDNKNGQITVTLKDLSTGDSGDYWCGIEIFYTSDDMHYTRLEVNEGECIKSNSDESNQLTFKNPAARYCMFKPCPTVYCSSSRGRYLIANHSVACLMSNALRRLQNTKQRKLFQYC
uniref:Immunoglobulin V-set domain-containing protein n=1 Tax=Erpetoichthys calabaricus TaxID=27687 RepID=A0A8C4XBZ8_ERPCA